MRSDRVIRWCLGFYLVGLLAGSSVHAQTATHSCSGYSSPGTATVSNQFARPVGTTNIELICVISPPSGWTVANPNAI